MRSNPGRPALMLLAANLPLFVLSAQAAQSEGALPLSDTAAYRQALLPVPATPAVPVTFRQLWESPQKFAGRRVRVQGVASRRFRQAEGATFPALSELWVASDAGDPFCLVYPNVGDSTKLGDRVVFEGTFLSRIPYEAGDGQRLVPLVVGSAAPQRFTAKPTNQVPEAQYQRWEWMVGAAVAALVAVVLAIQHSRFQRRSQEHTGPAPRFHQPFGPSQDDAPFGDEHDRP